MLPSSGYFKSALCPFYKNGFCERPHCHFRHTKTVSEAPGRLPFSRIPSEESDSLFGSSSKSDLLHLVNIAIQKVQNDMSLTEIAAAVEAEPVTYIPTPVEKCPVKTTSILKSSNKRSEKGSSPTVPEYRPTPISTLKKLQHNITTNVDEDKYEPTVNPPQNVSKKRKKVEEYDPTEVKCTVKKRVTFKLPEDKDDSDVNNELCANVAASVITIDSSDDETCVTGDGPQFSDDEEEDSVFSDVVSVENRSEQKGVFFSDDENYQEDTSCIHDKSIVNMIETIKDNIKMDSTKISEFSLVDKILVEVKNNDELIKDFAKQSPKLNIDNKDQSKGTNKQVISSKIKPKLSCFKGDKEQRGLKQISQIKEKQLHTDKRNTRSKKEKSDIDIKQNMKVNDLSYTDKIQNTKNNEHVCADIQQKLRISLGQCYSNQKVKMKEEGNNLLAIDTKTKVDIVDCYETGNAKRSEHITSRSKCSEKALPRNKRNGKESSKILPDSRMDEQENKTKSESLKNDQNKSKYEVVEGQLLKLSSSIKPRNDSVEYCQNDIQQNKTKLKTKKLENKKQKHILVQDKKSDSKIQDEKVSSSSSSSSCENILTRKKNHDSVAHSNSRKLCKKKFEEVCKFSKSTQKVSDKIYKVEKSSNSSTKKGHGSKKADQKLEVNTEKKRKRINFDSSGKCSASQSVNILEVEQQYNQHMLAEETDLERIDSDSEMDSDTYEECWRIFNEGSAAPVENTNSFSENSKLHNEEKNEELVVLGKKRLAHQSTTIRKQVSQPKTSQMTASQVMHNRYLQLQEMYARQNSVEDKRVPSAFLNSVNKNLDCHRKRIANIPSAELVAAVAQKHKAAHQVTSDNNTCTGSTVATTVSKGSKRIAHVPAVALKPRPIIPTEYGRKVPSIIRQRYLDNFINECLTFCLTEDEAYQIALNEEKQVYDRSINKTIYAAVAVTTLKRLRDRAAKESLSQIVKKDDSLPSTSSSLPTVSSTTISSPSVKTGNRTVSHEYVLGGSKAQRTSFSIERNRPKFKDTEIRGMMLYKLLKCYLLSPSQLLENGFPHPHPTEPGRATIDGIYVNKQPISNDPFKRICCRCQKSYFVDVKGNYVKVEECVYHWGRLWKKRIAGSLESRYSCCQSDGQSEGCCVGPGHVFEGYDTHKLKGFVKTLPKTPPPDGYYGVFSLDCEMCYTTAGVELTRITVINPDLKPVFETYVKPEYPVLDYNTRFSGITEEDLKDVKTSIRDVQAILLCMFNDKTILIGHSLESDFKALKLIHYTVVDTSVVFPHKMGLPYKRALRTLMAECLNKIIQNSLDGHDSQEDAVACMELMLWKVKDDLKRINR